MDGIEHTENDDQPKEETSTPEQAEQAEKERKGSLLKLAKERFQQAYDAHKDDFNDAEKVQEFIAYDQWPQGIKSDREGMKRPCLTLDHLNQYVRHVVNSGLMRPRDIRVLSMSAESDDKVAEVLAGMIRQITQTSTSKVAYETGLRHSCQVGFGYWRVRVQAVPDTKDLKEITIRKIKDPRMVLMDPFCDYPDGRDANYAFVMTKLTESEFKTQYSTAYVKGDYSSWHTLDSNTILPWIEGDPIIVAEYYYMDAGVMKWAIICPDCVLDEGIHHGNVMPIIRVVGEEYESRGKERKRGMINPSSMDAQRAYNYSSSAFIEAVALAPLAPYVAAEGQIEQYVGEWKDAHRVPRALLRYKPMSVEGHLVPPPQRAEPAGIPAGWQGMMTNLINDTQMIMGLAHPSVLGTGGAPVQSGAGIDAQKEPGEVNTFHFTEHWYMAIEQTGRVIMAMIPHVYNTPQAVKIVGDDGTQQTAMLAPGREESVIETMDAHGKVLSTAYNPSLGRYDIAISTGPSSASKKSETNKMLMTMVNADPNIMKIAGDLVVGSMDMAGADILARRMKALLPPGVGDDEAGKLYMLNQAMEENKSLKEQVAEMEKIIMGEREQGQAKLMEATLKHETEMQTQQRQASEKLMRQRMDDQSAFQIASLKAQVELEIGTQSNIVAIILEKMRAQAKVDVEIIKAFTNAGAESTHEGRMSGYIGVMDSLISAESTDQPIGG